ncbi:methanogenesis marker 8 protein [Methanobrevibacter filiformis]|nr:methanogenesis marker 8 protein [Methanobrevibacter filiformis]
MDEHIIEAMGKTKVVIKDGKVVEVGEPKINYCPLFHKRRGVEQIDKKAVKENMEYRMEKFGMCTPNREIEMNDFLSFGISEIISTLLEEKIIDCSIMVCDGAGTVIVNDPNKAQGIGGRVSGYVKTSPILEVIEKIKPENILDPENATINQLEGAKIAIKKGFKNIVVTITNSDDAKELRKLEKESENINIYLFSVHSTGVNLDESKELIKHCDVLTGCASKTIRQNGDEKALIKVGESIPIFGTTEIGKKFIEKRLEKIGGKAAKKDPKLPSPLI